MSPLPLGDTLFIILRKQQLIFLHWYHHITVLIYVWYSYMDHTAPGQWFLVMNYTVHALMYTYYAFRSMKFKISKWVSDLWPKHYSRWNCTWHSIGPMTKFVEVSGSPTMLQAKNNNTSLLHLLQVMMTITTLQLVQMIIGCFIAAYTHVQMQNGVFCNQVSSNEQENHVTRV